MKAALCIAMAGALGALARWGIVRWCDSTRGDGAFPLGILVANVGGCFLFGWFFGYLENRPGISDAVKLALFSGFLGSLTTFGWNTFDLVRNGQPLLALSNVGLSLFAGLGAVWGGYALGR